MRLVHRLLSILLHAWPQKLGALVLATLIWMFVNVNDTSITQRSLFVPISVEGLQSNSVATGLPEFVEVTVAGPSGQVDRLRPDNFQAVLDLEGQSGSFEEPITVLSPQAVELRRVNPSDVIGTVEAVTEKTVPVDVVIIGSGPGDVKVITTVEPAEVTVRARSSTLAQVARALAPVRPAPGDRATTPFAVNTAGLPVSGVQIQPSEVQVSVAEQPVLITRDVPVDLQTPAVPGFTVTAGLEQEQVRLVGPPSILASLESVPATVSLQTEEPQVGGYTLPVTLELPEGVQAVGTVAANVRLSRPPVRPN
ncbi:MAG TPA: CdaR family protein [Trueperaceae bacterium]